MVEQQSTQTGRGHEKVGTERGREKVSANTDGWHSGGGVSVTHNACERSKHGNVICMLQASFYSISYQINTHALTSKKMNIQSVSQQLVKGRQGLGT